MGLTTSRGLSLFAENEAPPATATGQTLMSTAQLTWVPKTVVQGAGVTLTEDGTSLTIAAAGGGVPASGTTGDLLAWNGSAWVGVQPGTLTLTSNNGTARTLSTGVAYQAQTPAKGAILSLTLASNASLTLGGGTTNTAAIYIGDTSAVATTGGTLVGTYSNSLTGTLVIGVSINTVATAPNTFFLPPNKYFAVRVSAGTVTIQSANDQTISLA